MELQAEDLIDILTPQLLKTWLKNPIAYDKFTQSVYEVPFQSSDWSKEDRMAIITAHKDFNNPDLDPLKLAQAVKEYLDRVLSEWKDNSSETTAKQMIASIPLFVEMSKYLPHINPDQDYDYAFRGTSFSMIKLRNFVKKTKVTDWKTTTTAGIKMMIYTGPAKNQFTYKPHRPVQSWSVSNDAAAEFGNAIIATPLDNTFFFEPEFLSTYGYKHEKETIHFGKQPMKVALLVNWNDWMDFRAGTFRANADLTETESDMTQISDDEGTLTLPQI